VFTALVTLRFKTQNPFGDETLSLFALFSRNPERHRPKLLIARDRHA
jgi:hypothetical protein